VHGSLALLVMVKVSFDNATLLLLVLFSVFLTGLFFLEFFRLCQTLRIYGVTFGITGVGLGQLPSRQYQNTDGVMH